MPYASAQGRTDRAMRDSGALPRCRMTDHPSTSAADIGGAQRPWRREQMAESERHGNGIGDDWRGHDQLEGHNGLPASPSRAAGSEFARGTPPSACSNPMMALVSEGWETPQRLAARVKLRSSQSARK